MYPKQLLEDEGRQVIEEEQQQSWCTMTKEEIQVFCGSFGFNYDSLFGNSLWLGAVDKRVPWRSGESDSQDQKSQTGWKDHPEVVQHLVLGEEGV